MHPGSRLLSAPEAPPATPAHRRRGRLVAAFVAVVLLVGGGWFTERGHDAADLDHLPWPAAGTASLTVAGQHVDGPGSDQVVPIASIAKVMTAFVILRDHPLRDGDGGPTITVSKAEAAAYAGQLAAGESLVRVEAGEQIDERQALEALLLPSADNMAWILARWDAGGQQPFLTEMNAEAKRLHLHHTRYTDASGLAADTVSTADDQVLLGAAAMGVPALAGIVAESTATIPVAGVVHNYNTALGHAGIIGLKTGSTSAAGGCLLFAARTGSGRLIVGAVLGQPGHGRVMLVVAIRAAERLVESAQKAAA